MTDPPLKAYPPIKRGTVKLEIPDDDQEVNNLVEENLILEVRTHSLSYFTLIIMLLKLDYFINLQPTKDSVVMADQPIIAYPPVQRTVKLEILDEHHEVTNYEEENQKLQVLSLVYFCI